MVEDRGPHPISTYTSLCGNSIGSRKCIYRIIITWQPRDGESSLYSVRCHRCMLMMCVIVHKENPRKESLGHPRRPIYWLRASIHFNSSSNKSSTAELIGPATCFSPTTQCTCPIPLGDPFQLTRVTNQKIYSRALPNNNDNLYSFWLLHKLVASEFVSVHPHPRGQVVNLHRIQNLIRGITAFTFIYFCHSVPHSPRVVPWFALN